jgi:ketosteroid isomerase-like protein
VTSLEDRVRRLEDRFEINDLLVRYAVLLDDRQFEAVGRLFTEDGVFASPNSTTEGRASIARNFEAKHEPFTMTLHDPHASACFFTSDDDARGTVLGYAELANGDHTIVTNIRYQDDYRREAGTWKFARRHVLSVYGMTVADFIAGRAGTAERKRWPDRPVGKAECPDIDQRYAGYVVQP